MTTYAQTLNDSDSPQNACDVAHRAIHCHGLTLLAVNAAILTERVRHRSRDHRVAGIVLMLLLPALAGLSATANAQSPQAPNPRTTVVVFADRPMPQGQWTALFSALQTGQANGGVETEALGGSAEFTRGDAAEPGLSVETPIVVFLHGNCDLAPLVRRTAFGVPLGWVHELHGQIEPFAHVDCTHIGQVLGPQALGLNRDQRTSIMAAAIARVILHEWIHIATQCSAHAEQGIEKAQFGVADLMAGDSQPAALLRSTR